MVLETNNGFTYKRSDILQITDINTVIYPTVICKNLVYTSTITAVHNLTSGKSLFIKNKNHIHYNKSP